MYRRKMGGYIVFECWGFKKVMDGLFRTGFWWVKCYPCHINVELSAWFIDMFALKRPNSPRYPIS